MSDNEADKKYVDFVHLHNHSHYSLLDGLSSPEDMAKTASDLNFKALALTDHGTCAGHLRFQRACENNGIKPILGCEFYFTEDHQQKHKDTSMYHLTVLSKNKQGLRNLFKLISIAETRGKYRKPRIDINLLAEHHEGLICTSGCVSSQISRAIIDNNIKLAKSLIGQHKDIFGDDFYIEIMTHKYLKSNQKSIDQEIREKKIAKTLFGLSKKMNIKAVATNDCHYAKKSQAHYHDILLSMQTGNTIKNPDRFSFDSEDFYIKPYEDMMLVYKSAPHLLSNTMEIEEKVESRLLGFHEDLLPAFDVPEGYESEEAFLKTLIKEGMIRKGLINKPEYRERIKFEMGSIIKCGYTRYFLILWDIINYANKNGIKVGVGRGSAVGSLCLYVMDIVGLDPIKYGLLFERFINPERISPPDVDLDFDYYRRDEIFDYLFRKYGIEHCSKIGTYNSFKAKAVIRYATKALDLGNDWEEAKKIKAKGLKLPPPKNSLKLSDVIAKQIDDGPNVTIESAMKSSKEFRETMAEYPELKETALQIEGKLSSAGVHAAGIVVCKDPIIEHIPLRESKGVICSQFDKEEVEELGLLKFDCLALKTITVINDTVKMIKARTGKDIDIDGLEPNDKKVLGLFDGKIPRMDNKGIFQFESPGMMKLLKNIRVDSIEDLIAANALYRPGPLGAGVHDRYCDYKHGREEIKPLHPKMNDILSKTYSLIVYQEDFMKIAQELAGFTKGQSDTLRKAVGKKKMDLLAKQKEAFVAGCVKNNIDKSVAEEIFKQIEYFGGYGFNKSHSAAYAFIAYQTAYLKVYYPMEYMCNLLSSEIAKEDKLKIYMSEFRRMGGDIRPPNINKSGKEFKIEKDEDRSYEFLRSPLNSIKDVGITAVDEIVDKQPFSSLKDFIHRINLRKVNSKVFGALVESGTMDDIWGMSREQILSQYDYVKKEVDKEKSKQRKQEKHNSSFGGMSLFDNVASKQIKI